ncbi:MAG: copper amine oxidase [Clostridiales bacterium]|jgi:N-acetylmuramoyl-L-alanine amidase|nr:copper amine oxidase [Clostridiales bacterium]
MKKLLLSWVFVLSLLTFCHVLFPERACAQASSAIPLVIDRKTTDVTGTLINSTTYVPLRAVTYLLHPGAEVAWENSQAIIRSPRLYACAKPGKAYMEANGRMLYIKDGVKLINGSTMVPIRVLAKTLGAQVSWDSNTKTVYITCGSDAILSGEQYYDDEDLYWLSRIISAESAGEPLEGKIAVGNVVINRVNNPDFPNSIYDVIFDLKWGVQFQPVANGTIYNDPTWESILAAKLCLDGASTAGDSLYFLNPCKSTNFWATKNCVYYSTIGNHDFYA